MMMDAVLWVVTTCNLAEIFQSFGGQKSYSENGDSRFLRHVDVSLPAYMTCIAEHILIDFFDVLLTVPLSIILVINQINA